MRRFALAVPALLALACATATPPAPAPPPPATAVELPESLRWTRDSAEHRAAFLQTYRWATEELAERAAGRAPGTWAVVLDADETILDNSQYQKENAAFGGDFDAASWDAWVARREATALPGAAAFLRRVDDLGGVVAVVTNRTEPQCPATEDVLRARGLHYDLVLCRGEERTKDGRWRSVAEGTAAPGVPPLDVVMFVGDNILDFPGLGQDDRRGPDAAFADFGGRFVLLPNPMYGSWLANPAE